VAENKLSTPFLSCLSLFLSFALLTSLRREKRKRVRARERERERKPPHINEKSMHISDDKVSSSSSKPRAPAPNLICIFEKGKREKESPQLRINPTWTNFTRTMGKMGREKRISRQTKWEEKF